MPKNKPHKGLLKRVRLTKSGRVKMQRAGGRHLRSHKQAEVLRRYRQPVYAAKAEAKRLSRLLNRPVKGIDAGPEQTTPQSDENQSQ